MDYKASVLIVDDDAGMCETLSDIMEDLDYCPVIALSGYEAIEKVREVVFDAILMDIKMPGLNGVETLQEIKKIRPDAAVLMMTAYAVQGLIKEALRAGAYGVLHKPLNVERAISLIESARERGAILVVDDDPDSCTIFKDILEERGYQVSIASSGEEAVETTREDRYDVVFIEVELPQMNGLETCLAIRKINPQAVVVMITANYQEADDLVEEVQKRDVYSCLCKPVDMREVTQLVDEICRRKLRGGG